MPLSDREQRILDEIERNLFQEDPDFARGVSEKSSSARYLRNAKLGGAAFAGGLVLLLVFFSSRLIIVGLAAFGFMVAGLVMLAGSLRGLAGVAAPAAVHRRRQIAQMLAQWEESVRRRYKKR